MVKKVIKMNIKNNNKLIWEKVKTQSKNYKSEIKWEK